MINVIIVIIILTSLMAIFYTSVFFFVLFIIIEDLSEADQCRKLKFTPEKAFDGKRLINHVIRVAEVTTKDFCENVCLWNLTVSALILINEWVDMEGTNVNWTMLLTKDTNTTWRMKTIIFIVQLR